MSEKLTVRTAKKISRKLENGTHFLGTVCQSVPFFRKNAKEFINLGKNQNNDILQYCGIKVCNFLKMADNPS